MALLERVTTLIRANLNDLIDKAEDPEKLIKQVILDMENQLIQVKTQVAVAVADQQLLEKKRKETEEKAAEWMKKAELAVDNKKEDLARAALERSLSSKQMAESIKQQEADQKAQTEILKVSLKTLGEKLAEAQSKRDLLIAQHRRARMMNKTVNAQAASEDQTPSASRNRFEDGATRSEKLSQIKADLLGDELENKFASLEKDGQIDRMLAELKARRSMS
jgi:phage shock protein A